MTIVPMAAIVRIGDHADIAQPQQAQPGKGRVGILQGQGLFSYSQNCLNTVPPFMTKRTRRSAVMFCVGSPSTAMRSASKPGPMRPN